MTPIKRMDLAEVEAEIAFAALDGRVLEAAEEWRRRRYKTSRPTGRWDNGGRFHPDADEREACCAGIREPSRAYPYSYWTHVHSAVHVAEKFGVDPTALRRVVRLLERRVELVNGAE